jgi:hypothetical protein
MRRLFALPALFTIALLVPLAAVMPPASAANDAGPIILSGPDAVTTRTTASFTFDPSIQDRLCTLDAVRVDCSANPWTPTLGTGNHELTVTGTQVTPTPPICDAAGCIIAPPAYNPVSDHWGWKIVSPPAASLTAPAKPFQLGTSATLSWRTTTATGAPAVSRVELSSRRAGTNGTFGTPTTRTFTPTTTKAAAALKSGYTSCFRVRAIDASGTAGPWSAERCVSVPLDDRAMTTSKGWRQTRATSAYKSTLTTAKSARRTLSKTGIRAARVGIVATTCRTCGKVTVKIGTKVIGTINLHSATTKHRRMLLLPAFTPRTGKLTLTTTSKRMVQIDGVAVSAR